MMWVMDTDNMYRVVQGDQETAFTIAKEAAARGVTVRVHKLTEVAVFKPPLGVRDAPPS
jgi:hypothetical protein